MIPVYAYELQSPTFSAGGGTIEGTQYEMQTSAIGDGIVGTTSGTSYSLVLGWAPTSIVEQQIVAQARASATEGGGGSNKAPTVSSISGISVDDSKTEIIQGITSTEIVISQEEPYPPGARRGGRRIRRPSPSARFGSSRRSERRRRLPPRRDAPRARPDRARSSRNSPSCCKAPQGAYRRATRCAS